MTFDEWLKTQPILSDNYIIVARKAWEAGFQSGQDHQRELERLAEYDRSVFCSDEYSKDW